MASKNEIASLFISLKANTGQFTSNINKASRSAKTSFTGMAASLGKIAAGMAVAVAAAAVKIGVDFEKAFKKVQVSTGFVGKDMESLKDSIKLVSAGTSESLDGISAAFGAVITRFKSTAQQAEEAVKPLADFAELTGQPLEQIANSMVDVVSIFGGGANDVGNMLDMLVVGSQDAGVGIDKLTAGITEYGASLKAAGMDMEQSISFLSQIDAAGGKIARTMPGISALLGKTFAEGDFQEIFDIQMADTFTEKLRIAVEFIQKAETETQKVTRAQKLFGVEAANSWLLMINNVKNADDILGGQIDSFEGATNLWAEHTRTIGEDMTIMWKQVQLALEPLGAELIAAAQDYLPDMIAAIQDAVTVAKPFIVGLGAILKVVLKLSAALVELGNSGIGAIVKGMGDSIKQLVQWWRGGSKEIASSAASSADAVAQAFAGATQQVGQQLNQQKRQFQDILGEGASPVTINQLASGSTSASLGLSLPGFATGGSFDVGGTRKRSAGPTDSQLVAFMATPGETVTVTTPGQERAKDLMSAQANAGGSSQVFNITTGVQETVRAELLSLLPTIQASNNSQLVTSTRYSTSLGQSLKKQI